MSSKLWQASVLTRAPKCWKTASCELAPGSPWMVGGLGVDVLPLVPHAVAAGGHVRVGLEDAPFGSARSNLDWVETAAKAIEGAGGRVATAGEIRAALKPAGASRP